LKEWWDKIRAYLRPTKIVNNIYEINFDHLRDLGIKALILDIDDTLIPRRVNDIYPQVFEWVMARKEEGFKLCLTSNSRHPLRIKYISDTLKVPALALSFKPLPFAFWKSLKILGTNAEETAMIGDQLFMDILGGNIVKIYTVFVKHLTPETFPPRIWMRRAEEWVLENNK